MLDAQDTRSMGQKTTSIYVSCPLRGLSEELDSQERSEVSDEPAKRFSPTGVMATAKMALISPIVQPDEESERYHESARTR